MQWYYFNSKKRVSLYPSHGILYARGFSTNIKDLIREYGTVFKRRNTTKLPYIWMQKELQRFPLDYSSSTFPLKRFLPACFFFDCNRRLTEPFVGLVAIRFFWTTLTLLISSVKRSSASSLFCSWLRCCCDLMTMMPSLVIRLSLSAVSYTHLTLPTICSV